MIAALAIAVRFGLYLDLMLMFGVPAFALYTFRPDLADTASALPVRAVVLVTGVLGLMLSAAGVAIMAASMGGSGLAAVGRDEIVAVLTATVFGTATLVRLVALGLALLFMLRATSIRSGMMYSLTFAAIALASLAWSGHAAMTDNLAARVHLVADILHLWASGGWIGALASLMILIGRFDGHSGPRGAMVYRAFAGFALPGSLLVATLVLTGVLNTWVLVGPAHLTDLPASRYGQLLLLKLALFAAMLGLAMLNRVRLTPRLLPTLPVGRDSATALRRSLTIETTLGGVILALVAWLGTLTPPGGLP